MAAPIFQRKRPQEQLYFAFGSNLHLGQMAKRCPESRFIGTAILHNYRFQINQRGFANILYRRNDHVEGLLYLLSRTDEDKLDRSEGVPTAYQKHHLTVQVFTAGIAHVGRAVPELAQQLDYSEYDPTHFTISAGSHDRSRSTEQSHVHRKTAKKSSNPWRQLRNLTHQHVGVHSETDAEAEAIYPRLLQGHYDQTAEALVYISQDFQEDSEPRSEYIDRMNAGMIHARKLGISDFYIDNCLRRCLAYRQLPKQGYAYAQQRNPQDLNHRQGHSNSAGTGPPDGPSRAWHEKRQPAYTSFEHSGEIDADTGYRESRFRRESTPSRSSATTVEDRKARHLKHESSEDTSESESEDTSDSEVGPYYPEDESRHVATVPRMSASTVKDSNTQQHEHKRLKISWSSPFYPHHIKGRSRRKSRPPRSIIAAADDQRRRRSRHRVLENAADID